MADTSAPGLDRPLATHLLVGVEQSMDCPVADGVSGELQPALRCRSYHAAQTLGRNEEHTAIGRIRNAIDRTHAPGRPHICASSEPPAIEKGLDPDESQPIVG